jgi:hypothetical protein
MAYSTRRTTRRSPPRATRSRYTRTTVTRRRSTNVRRAAPRGRAQRAAPQIIKLVIETSAENAVSRTNAPVLSAKSQKAKF